MALFDHHLDPPREPGDPHALGPIVRRRERRRARALPFRPELARGRRRTLRRAAARVHARCGARSTPRFYLGRIERSTAACPSGRERG